MAHSPVPALILHALGLLSDRPLEGAILLLVLRSAGRSPGGQGAQTISQAAVPPLGTARSTGGLPSVEQGLVARQLVQQRVARGTSAPIGQEHWWWKEEGY